MPTLYDSDSEEKIIVDNETDEIDSGAEADFPPKLRSRQPEDTVDPDAKDSDHKRTLNESVEASQRILYKAKNIFPFDFFPDEIIIDEHKVDIITGHFFYSKEIFSIPIQNISGVNSSFNLFFGQLRIEAWGLTRVPPPIKYLPKQHAIEARRIISGLVMAHNENIELNGIPLPETKQKLELIGRAREPKNVNTS